MVEADGEVAPFPDRMEDEMIIALPLVSGSRTLGVWIGEVGAAVRSADEVRMLPLLADFLAARLRELLPAPGGVVPSWSREALLAALEPEAARSLRGGGTLALIDLRIEAPRDVKFDIARLSGSMRAMLRPYDLLAVAEDAPGRCWRVVLPLSGGEGPLPAAHRLCTLVEDFLDSEGGVEERGIRVGLGISVLPADAANTEEMVENAAAAAVRALAHAEPSAVVLHEATQEAWSERADAASTPSGGLTGDSLTLQREHYRRLLKALPSGQWFGRDALVRDLHRRLREDPRRGRSAVALNVPDGSGKS